MSDEDKQWTAEYWTANQTECTECNRIIDAAGQCDCDFDPLWWDTPNRRCLPANTKANKNTQRKHMEGLQSCHTQPLAR